MVITRKKLIEVALPLDAINTACINEANPFTPRHPRSLHVWWARRRLAISRAVIFAQMVDDPSSHPEEFPDKEIQDVARQRLFHLIGQLCSWENTANPAVLQQARDEIWKSWRSTCFDNKDHPRADQLFNPEVLPAFHDPFAGGGALPLEAQRLGLESHASDLNPVAVLMNKAMIEIPSKFSTQAPVNPSLSNENTLVSGSWTGANGLAEDVRYYGQWLKDEAVNRINHLYPQVEIGSDIARDRPGLQEYSGKTIPVFAWIWARTVKSPNPAFAHVDVPLTSTFMLSTKPGKEAYVSPIVEGDKYRFVVKLGLPEDVDAAKKGTKVSRGGNFTCLISGTPISSDYVYSESKAGRMSSRLMAVVVEGSQGREYLPATDDIELIKEQVEQGWRPDLDIPHNPRYLSPPLYGMVTYADLFTSRQLATLTAFSDLISEVRKKVHHDALSFGLVDDGIGIDAGGIEASGYADAISTYLGIAVSRWTDLFNSLNTWNTANQNIKNLFSRQAIPMAWDFVESNPCGTNSLFLSIIESIYKMFVNLPCRPRGFATQFDAQTQSISRDKIISTDPPYYANVGYADLSDFFYVWLRHHIRPIYPDLFATMAVPKSEELVANPYRLGNNKAAENFFLTGMTGAMSCIAGNSHPAFPVTIYYAYKQKENKDGATTGWETFLEAVIRSGFAISGTWPARTERTDALKREINALSSSIVIVCRPQEADAPTATRRDFLTVLQAELPDAIAHLQTGNIAPVDLAQAVIGPGMAIFTRYSKVLDSSGAPLSVHDALSLIDQTREEVLTQQEGDFDVETRWALSWCEQWGFEEGEFGVAEILSTAKNTSVAGMVEAGILVAGRGKVRLLLPTELPEDWDPQSDRRPTTWESVHHLVRVLQNGSESAAADLQTKIGPSSTATTRELAYRLYTICERKGWAKEALWYNSLVQSWPEITRLAQTEQRAEQGALI